MARKQNKFYEASSRTLKVAITLFASILIIGTLGFHLLEGIEFLDSLYMKVITVSTVGLIMTSLGNLAYVGTNLARFVFDGELANYIK